MLTRNEMNEIISREVEISTETMESVLDFVEETWNENSNGIVFQINGEMGTGKSKLLRVMQKICSKTLFIDDGFVLDCPDRWIIKHMVLVGYEIQKIDLPIRKNEHRKISEIINKGAERA